jgi:hypothetical protein
MSSMAAMFYLLLVLYHGSLPTIITNGNIFFSPDAAFLIAMLTKENAFTLPFVFCWLIHACKREKIHFI